MRTFTRGALLSLSAIVVACSSSSTTTEGPAQQGGGTGTNTTKAPPSTAAEAPTLEHFESTIQETVTPGNTPLPQGVRCEPDSDKDDLIVYACTVFASKTQTADQVEMTCAALNVKLDASSGDDVTLTPTKATKTGTDFGLELKKDDIPRLGAVTLDASCSPGGSVKVTRPYRLTPKP